MKEKSADNGKKLKIIYGIIALLILLIILILLLGGKNQYKVAFDSNGGSEVASIIVDENGLAQKPEDPTRPGYVFVGWYYNDEPFDFSTPITSEIELEARWAAEDKAVKVTGVKLDKTQMTLTVGSVAQLKATVLPENATIKDVIFKSSNPDVVSVDKDGNIKALKAGKATITVTTKDGSLTATAEIIVKAEEKKEETTDKTEPSTKPETDKDKEQEKDEPVVDETVKVTGVTLNKKSVSLYINETTKLTATVKPNNADNKNVTWKSSNPSVVSVDSKGNIKALKEGTATITVTTEDGNYTASCTVEVSKKPDSYVVTFTTSKMEGTGSELQYPVTVTKNGSACSYKFIIYNGTKVVGNLSAEDRNTNITTATIRLNNGTDVTATVKYN